MTPRSGRRATPPCERLRGGRRSWRRRRFSATSSWLAMWVTPVRGSTWCGRPAARSAAESWSVWAPTTLSSASPWRSSSGRSSLAASGSSEQRRSGRRRRRVAEVALRVEGVVEPPVGHGGTGDGGVEDVGSAQHRERGEVAAEAPPADGHPGEVEARVLGSEREQPVDLVLQHRAGEVAVDAALPRPRRARACPARRSRRRRSPGRRTTGTSGRRRAPARPVGRGARRTGRAAPAGVGIADVVGEQQGGGQAALADVADRHVRASPAAWRPSPRGAGRRPPTRSGAWSSSDARRTTIVSPPTTALCTPSSAVSCSSAVVGPPPHGGAGGVVDRVGGEHHAVVADVRDGAHVEVGRA